MIFLQAEMRRHVYVTPKSYLDLLSSYSSLLGSKRSERAAARQRLVTGVVKLEDTKAMVAGLQVRFLITTRIFARD